MPPRGVWVHGRSPNASKDAKTCDTYPLWGIALGCSEPLTGYDEPGRPLLKVGTLASENLERVLLVAPLAAFSALAVTRDRVFA